MNREHAIVLNALFNKQGIRSAFIISGTKAEFIGIDLSNKANEENIAKFKSGQLDVLINVNILTEGADLPETQTVFLTRPTVSSTLMTQMIGRALRGAPSGGTNSAYIVSFIDNWKDKIAWVNAENLYIEEENEFLDSDNKYSPKIFRVVSIAKIEEFARILDETVDTSKLEKLEFIKRIPLGMYVLSFIEEETEHNYQVLVYDSTKAHYDEMLLGLPDLFKEYNLSEETIPADLLTQMAEECAKCYFDDPDMLPSINERDIKNILKYYAQKECIPQFIEFEDLDRKKLDISIIAKEIVQKDMRPSEVKELIDRLWDDENSLIKVYFSKKIFLKRQLDIEIDKLNGYYDQVEMKHNIEYDQRELERLSLFEVAEMYPEVARDIRDEIFNRHRAEEGYICAICGKVSRHKGAFQIDHVKPMNDGGQTVLENLQLLCRKCNLIKGDTYVQN